MTAQISDTFIYQEQKYNLVALQGEGLIVPQDYNMQPEMLHTACYRGFYSTYEVTDDGLFLIEMVIGEVKDGYKSIQGIMPYADGNRYTTYKGLRLLVPFTGIIRLGKDFINTHSVNMGYQKASAYATLLELTFDAGIIVLIKDLSSSNSKKHGAFKNKFESNNIHNAVRDAFSLDIQIE